MLIVFRIAVALVAFLARWIGPLFRPGASGSFAGQPWYKKVEKTKRGDVVSFKIGMPLKAPVIFRLQREESSDRWFKEVGLAHEFQTGDAKFDDTVYIACDHPALHRLLKEKPEARARIRSTLKAGFSRITGDGRMLWIERVASEEPGNDDLQQLSSLRAALAEMPPALTFFRDPYNTRVVAVEALTWSVFAYALGGFLEYSYDKSEVHLEPVALVAPGLIAGTMLVFALVALVWWLLRGSARGSRILIEGVVLLVLSAPMAGIQLVADANRVLDRSQPSVSRWIVKDKFTVRGRKQPTRYNIVLGPGAGATTTDVPGQITVASDVYERARRGKPIEVQISPGAFGYRWYRKVDPE